MANSGKSRKTSSPSTARKPKAKPAKPAAKAAGKGKTIAVEKSRYAELTGQMQAINRAMAVIQFDTSGQVICANDNFQKVMGYRLDELQGRHHRMFVEPAEVASHDYERFWERLRAGEYVAGQFKRLAKDGHEVWLEASYNPILDDSGKVTMVVKYATDVTAKMLKAADDNGQLQAIGRAMAVIEFELDGTVRCANENFLKVMGYRLDEIKGRHHRMFVDRSEAESREYDDFWSRLRAGEYVAGQFKRLARDGHEVWLQASYNAILDASGKVVKVVKYASDISADVMMQKATQKAVDDVQAVVEKACMGDLGVRVPEDDKSGNLKVLVQGVNHVLGSSGKVLGDIREALDAIGEGRLTIRIPAGQHQGGFRDMVEGVNRALDAVIDPLNVAAQYVDLISKGNIPAPITDSYKGDFNTIKNNLNTCIRVVNALVADANMLSVAAVEGRLATRADASKHEGDFRKIVQGVNDTLDAVIGPLNVAASYVDQISKGAIPAPITDNYNGDFNTIKTNLNRAIEAVNKMVADAELLSVAAVEGRLATRADASKHEGDFRKIVQGVNDTLDAVIGPLNVAASYVDQISKGAIPAPITDSYNGDFNTIKTNLNTCIRVVNALVADANMLSVAAVEGRLATRADASKHEGDFRKIVQGVNDTLDAVIGPLNVAASYVDQISKGAIPAPITDNYNGDFNTIKTNLNRAIEAVNKMVADANLLSVAAVEGRLATRADASKHEGDFRKIVQGVNDTLDAVIGPLNVAARYVDQISKGDIPAPITDSYNGDFNTIKINLNRAIDAVNKLVSDANLLSQAAVEGRLETRADASRHEGDFRKIVQGVNDTLDAVVAPINETGNVLAALAMGDLTRFVQSDYRGAFDKMKEDTNHTVRQLGEIVSQIQQATNTINLAAREIAAGNNDLSGRTEQQAASLQETASSMEELTSTVRQNAENARQANQLAVGASDVARKGGQVVGEVVTTMAAINDASKKIVDIISVIDGIAFQTNILALNAAVEAARAGEQGRGFAVVASEVRSLAQRSAAAAKEIKGLIGDSVEKVGAGSKLVEHAGKTMEEIVNSVKRVTDIMTEISAASQEQSQGIEQVNKTVTQMDEVTQQNAALVEQASASARSMEEQAGKLAESVSRFRLEDSGTAGAPATLKTAADLLHRQRAAVKPAVHKPAASLGKPASPAAAVNKDGQWAEF